MTRPAMFTAQRKAALAIATEWTVPGMDSDDVRQEALIALWIAAGKHDPERGPWPAFARMCIRAHLFTLHQAATRAKRTAVVLELDENRDAAPETHGGQLELLVEALPSLTVAERTAVAAHLNGTPATVTKQHNNALARARRKLRCAA